MHCKYCHTAIPSTTCICPNCGKMATKDQIKVLKNFNKNSPWNKNNSKERIYKDSAYESNKIFGIILVSIVILILVIVAFIRVMTG